MAWKVINDDVPFSDSNLIILDFHDFIIVDLSSVMTNLGKAEEATRLMYNHVDGLNNRITNNDNLDEPKELIDDF